MSNIIVFKAGRLHRRENTNWVDPSPTRGTIQLLVAPEDGLLHFQWSDRTTNTVEDDLIIFPSEASFEKVSQASGGRTYVLKFTSSNQKHFFWLQDASTERDDQLVVNVNGILQDPEYSPRWEDVPPLSQPQASTSTAASVRTPTDQQLSELRNILSQISQGPGTAGAAQAPELSLADILTPAHLAPLFASGELVRSIFPHLPPDLPVPPSAEALQRIIESPQFQAALRSLDQALATGLLGGLVRGLGLPEEAGTGVGPFLRAISEQAQRDGSGHEDDRMETD